MKPRLNSIRLAMTLTPLALLVSGCASVSPPSQPPLVVEPAKNPALPAQARQPKPPKICSNGCSAGLMKLRTELLDSLIKPTPQDQPASAPTTP